MGNNDTKKDNTRTCPNDYTNGFETTKDTRCLFFLPFLSLSFLCFKTHKDSESTISRECILSTHSSFNDLPGAVDCRKKRKNNKKYSVGFVMDPGRSAGRTKPYSFIYFCPEYCYYCCYCFIIVIIIVIVLSLLLVL